MQKMVRREATGHSRQTGNQLENQPRKRIQLLLTGKPVRLLRLTWLINQVHRGKLHLPQQDDRVTHNNLSRRHSNIRGGDIADARKLNTPQRKRQATRLCTHLREVHIRQYNIRVEIQEAVL